MVSSAVVGRLCKHSGLGKPLAIQISPRGCRRAESKWVGGGCLAERAAEGGAGSGSLGCAGGQGSRGMCQREKRVRWGQEAREPCREGRRREGAFGGQGSRGCMQTVSGAWPRVGILKASWLPWAIRELPSQSWLGAALKGSHEVWKGPPWLTAISEARGSWAGRARLILLKSPSHPRGPRDMFPWQCQHCYYLLNARVPNLFSLTAAYKKFEHNTIRRNLTSNDIMTQPQKTNGPKTEPNLL